MKLSTQITSLASFASILLIPVMAETVPGPGATLKLPPKAVAVASINPGSNPTADPLAKPSGAVDPFEIATPGTPIKVGAIFPLTGPSSDMGNSSRAGAEIAVKETNEAGGYRGRPIKLIVKDDESKPDIGEARSKELIAEGVVAVVGFCNTGVAMKSLPLFQEKKIPLIISCATGTSITAKYPAKDSYIFRIAPTSRIQAEFIVRDALSLNRTKIAILADSTPYGDIGLKDIEESLAKKGIKPHAVERFAVGSKTLVEEVKRLKASGADALIGWTVSADQGIISKSVQEARWEILRYGDWTFSNDLALKTSEGSVNKGRMPQSTVYNPYIKRNHQFLADYKRHEKKNSAGSYMSGAQSYDSMNILVRSFFGTKNDISGPAIKNALENFDRPHFGVVAVYERPFSTTEHDAISLDMLWMGAWSDGQRVYAYKDDENKAVASQRKRQKAL